MRILYYSPHPHLNLGAPSGYATHMREMIRAFRELGHEVDTLIMGGEDPQPPPSDTSAGWKGIAKSVVPGIVWETLKDLQLMRFDRRAAQALQEKVRHFQPDLIYERGNYMQISGVRVAQATGVFHVLEMNSPYLEERIFMQGHSWLMGVARRQERIQVRQTNRLVTVSSALEAYYVTTHKLPAEKCLVTPNSIDPGAFRPDERRKTELIRNMGLAEKTVIGFVGAIFPYHGVDILIEAFGSLAANHPNALLLIVGDGAIVPELRALADRVAPGRVVFTGKMPYADIPNYIDIMDIAAIAQTKWYMSPIKIFEYGAMGKAIVAPDTVPVHDVMQDRVHGLIAKPEVPAIRTALETLIADPTLRQQLGKAFQAKVRAEHTWMHNAAKILASY